MRQIQSALQQKITARDARICVVGLGYVGLPLAVEFARAGFRATGIDTDRYKVAGVRAGRSHVQDVAAADVAELVRRRRLTAQADYRG